eukprot:5215263-Heterocapsa_arctica.AAC.1
MVPGGVADSVYRQQVISRMLEAEPERLPTSRTAHGQRGLPGLRPAGGEDEQKDEALDEEDYYDFFDFQHYLYYLY